MKKNFGVDLDIPNLDKLIYGIESKENRAPINKTIKDNILITQKWKCKLCGLSFATSGVYPPDYHHKDGNPANSKESNIIAICPNCHRKETRKQLHNKATKKNKEKMKSLKKKQPKQYGLEQIDIEKELEIPNW